MQTDRSEEFIASGRTLVTDHRVAPPTPGADVPEGERYVFEIRGEIIAASESAADALAEKIARDARNGYRFVTLPFPTSVIASADVESFAPKQVA